MCCDHRCSIVTRNPRRIPSQLGMFTGKTLIGMILVVNPGVLYTVGKVLNPPR